MRDICNTIPDKPYNGSISYYHFVFEMGIQKLRQPFLHTSYYMYLVLRGTAVLKGKGISRGLKAGTVFITPPYEPYEITDYEDFVYLYISFGGTGAPALLKSMGVGESISVYENHNELLDFWMDSIRRVHPGNANILTESVLMYTLSVLEHRGAGEFDGKSDKFSSILEHIDNNFSNPELSLGTVAAMYFYNEKYLSALFKKRTGRRFSEYLNEIRIQRARELLKEGDRPLSAVATLCGFANPLYFSKVFKKLARVSPTEYRNTYRKSEN